MLDLPPLANPHKATMQLPPNRPLNRPPNRPAKSRTRTQARRDLTTLFRVTDDDSHASRRYAQVLANSASQLRLIGSVNDMGHFEIKDPTRRFGPELWGGVRICLENLSEQDTHKTSPDPSVIALEGSAGVAKQYLKAVNASINLLRQLGLSKQRVARVLTEFPDIVRFVHVNGPKRFTLTGTSGGKPQISSITTTVILNIAAMLALADQPAACCDLLAACGPKAKHLKGLLLLGHAAALAYWPSSRERELLKMLAEVGKSLQREDPRAWRELVSSRALPSSIRAALWPEMAKDVQAKAAQEAALKLLTTWVSALPDSPDTPANILMAQLGKDDNAMSRLLDLARVLADQSLVLDDPALNIAFMACREDLAAALIHAAHGTFRIAWVGGEARIRDSLNETLMEIPKANEGDPPKALRPLVQCLQIGIVLRDAVSLAIWIPMLDDVEKHMWSETPSALAALRDEIVFGLWQVEEQFPDLEVATVQATLRTFGTTVRKGREVTSTPDAIRPPRSDDVLQRRTGAEVLARKLAELDANLSVLSTNSELLARIKLIISQSEILPHLSGDVLGAIKEMDRDGQLRIFSLLRTGGLLSDDEPIDGSKQQSILISLLRSVECRDFLRWMAVKAGYGVLRDVMVSLLGSPLHLTPRQLCEMLMSQSEDLRFALAVALSPLVSALVPDESAPALAELLLKQWSRRADAPTLLFEACVGSKQHLDANTAKLMFQVCAAPTMYPLLIAAAAREHVLDGPPDRLQQCIDRFLNVRQMENKHSRRFALFVLADCALRCRVNAGVFERAIDGLSAKAGVLFLGNLANGGAIKVFNALHGDGADPWLRVRFSILAGSFDQARALEAAIHLLQTFPEEAHDDLLRDLIFQSKLSPLPRNRNLEEMTEDDIDQWKARFAGWCVQLRWHLHDEDHFLRVCRLILSELMNAQASTTTVSHVLTLIEKEIAHSRALWGTATEVSMDKFRLAVEGAKTGAKGEGKKKEIRLPELLHARLPGTDVESLTEVGDNVDQLQKVIHKLIEYEILGSELQLMLVRGATAGLKVGIAQPNLLLALLLKKDPIDGLRRPSPELLAWLGQQCCAWPDSGKFVNFLYVVSSNWTPHQWATMVDVEQVAAFMSGVLQSALDFLGENYKNILDIHVEVTTLIRFLEKLIFERFEPKDFDSGHVLHCLKLLEYLKAQPGVRM